MYWMREWWILMDVYHSDPCGLHHNLDSRVPVRQMGEGREKKRNVCQYYARHLNVSSQLISFQNEKILSELNITPQRSDCTLPGAHTEGLQSTASLHFCINFCFCLSPENLKRKQHQSLWRPKAQNPQLATSPFVRERSRILRSESRKLKNIFKAYVNSAHREA